MELNNIPLIAHSIEYAKEYSIINDITAIGICINYYFVLQWIIICRSYNNVKLISQFLLLLCYPAG